MESIDDTIISVEDHAQLRNSEKKKYNFQAQVKEIASQKCHLFELWVCFDAC